MALVGVAVYQLVWGGIEDRAIDELRQSGWLVRIEIGRLAEGVARATAAAAEVESEMARAGSALPVPALDTRLRRWTVAADLDVGLVADGSGAVVASIRRPGLFAPGVRQPTDAELLTGQADGRALVSRVAVGGSGRTVVGAVWLDGTRLERMYRPDGVGLVLLAGSRPVASTLPPADLPPLPAEGTVELRLEGERWTGVVVPVPRTPVTVLALARPPLDARNDLLVILAALAVTVAVLIVVVGTVLSRVIARPLRDLATAAEAVSGGDFDQRVAVSGNLETAVLGRAFNTMTDNLQEQVRQLARARTDFGRAIASLGDVLGSTDNLPRIIEAVLETSALTVQAEKAIFWERVAMPARIRSTAVLGGVARGTELNGTGVAGAAGLHLRPVAFPGRAEPAEGEPAVETAAAVPMTVDGRLFGVLAVYGRSEGPAFGPDDLDLLQTLARQAEVAIGNVMLHEETRRQARTDDLTGLWNRREFSIRFREAVKQAERFADPLGMMLVDIDDFRDVNNNFSHLHGNAALVALAARLSEATREVDVVARWGGEEFVVLLPRAELDETGMVAERVRALIAGEPVVHDGAVFPLTVSIGYAGFPTDGRSADELFRAADAALLRAKRLGKNRVEQARTNEGVR